VTLHVPEARVQLVALKVPVELVVNETEPVGVTAPVPDASPTVAVHVVATLSRTLAGLHETAVLLARIVEVNKNVPLLAVWTESPL
jgi:hypothetical protein